MSLVDKLIGLNPIGALVQREQRKKARARDEENRVSYAPETFKPAMVASDTGRVSAAGSVGLSSPPDGIVRGRP